MPDCCGGSTRDPPSLWLGFCFDSPGPDGCFFCCWVSWPFWLGGAAQLPHPRLHLVHQPQVVVVANDGRRGHGQPPLHERPHRRGLQIRQAARWLSRTPVRFSVRAMEKKAMAAVISSRGSAKRRIRAHEARDAATPDVIGHDHVAAPSSPVRSPPPVPGPSAPESCPAGRRALLVPARETPATPGLAALLQTRWCRPGRRPCGR